MVQIGYIIDYKYIIDKVRCIFPQNECANVETLRAAFLQKYAMNAVETRHATSLQNHVRTVILNDLYDYRDYTNQNHNNQTNHTVEMQCIASLQQQNQRNNKYINFRTAGNRINTAINFMKTFSTKFKQIRRDVACRVSGRDVARNVSTKIRRDGQLFVSTITKIGQITKIAVLTVIFGLSVMGAKAQTTVPCGNGVTYAISGTVPDLTLTIYYIGAGTGEMDDYSYGGAPWYAQKDDLKILVINNGVTRIGNNAFADCSNLTEITCLPTTPPMPGTDVFLNVPTTIPVYVPFESYSDYAGVGSPFPIV
jgi:hypothetical protein